MKKPKEQRIYVVVAKTIDTIKGKVTQPLGRQAAQACHVVSKLRHRDINFEIDHQKGSKFEVAPFKPITTIILQVRDSAELQHVFGLLCRKRIIPSIFMDYNPEYGLGEYATAIAVFATKEQTSETLDYLPLWSEK